MLEVKAISMKPIVLMQCRHTIKKFCSNSGRDEIQTLQCLQDHIHEHDFPLPCKDAVMNDMVASSHDWRLKYGISTQCKTDVQNLCVSEMKIGGGSVLKCLTDKYKEVG